MADHARLEHVNITVGDPDRTANMLQALFGWQIRWEGPAIGDGRTIHVGSDTDYVAIYRPGGDAEIVPFAKGKPMNHIGVAVDDLDATERAVRAIGLEPYGHDSYEPGKRFYFFDWDGIEWEVVSYA